MNPLKPILIAAIRLYQRLLSPALTALLGPLGFGCRFQPTCSQYALDALRIHGCLKGSWLALRRLGRCHPWGAQGHDPVPPPADSHHSHHLRLKPESQPGLNPHNV